MKYALIRNNKVENVIEADAAFISNIQSQFDTIIETHAASPGDTYEPVSKTFTRPVDTTPMLTITLDKTLVVPSEVINAAVSVRSDNSLVPISGNYFVPIFDIDGRKIELLKVTLTGGQGSVQFSLTERGIYTLDISKIRPKPTSKLADSPEVIVA